MINCPQFTRKPHGDTARKVGLLLFLLALTEPGFAQEPRSSTRFGAPKLPTIDQPEYLKKEPKPTLGLPPVEPAVEPTPAPQERVPEKGVPLSEAGLVMVRRFAFEGNRVFTDAHLAEVTAPYEGRPITSEELQYVRHALTLFYVEQGYINSGVVIPDQEVKDGVVRLRVVEGRLTRIEVSGNQRLRTPYIEKRLALGEGPPLNLFDLQHQVQMLDQNPLIEQINADLGPGLAPGEAVLRARVVEADPLSFGFETNNYRSPSVGATQLVGWAGNGNLTGWGDSAYVSYAISEGIDDWNLNYRLPVSPRDTSLTLDAEYQTSKVDEDPFKELDIESQVLNLGAGIRHPFYKTLRNELSAGLRFEYRYNKTWLLDRPFSFSPGADNGKSVVTVVRLFGEWTHKSRNQVIAARSTFNFGVDAFDATNHSDGRPDSQFFSWLGQFQWARRMVGGSQLLFRADAQLSNDGLLPLEKFAVGGPDTVRGYRVNQFVRDNGWVAALELRIPIYNNPARGGMIQIAPFVDVGRSWNEDLPDLERKFIAGTGIGLRWDPTPKLHAQVYWGYALKDVDEGGTGLQDKGIYFQLSYRG